MGMVMASLSSVDTDGDYTFAYGTLGTGNTGGCSGTGAEYTSADAITGVTVTSGTGSSMTMPYTTRLFDLLGRSIILSDMNGPISEGCCTIGRAPLSEGMTCE